MKFYSFLTNNILINNFLIATGLDQKKELSVGQWKSFKYNADKSLQQNAGFSHSSEVDDALDKVKEKLKKSLSSFVPKQSKILDLGCGPGIYMNMLSADHIISGVDISSQMLEMASEKLPECKFYLGNFLAISFEDTYKAIYSISVLEYIPVSKIDVFFNKCAQIMDSNGLLFIQYPHALKRKDLFYPDRNYINYSPALITKVASRYFEIIENKHSYDGRDTCIFDTKPYQTDSKTFKNGYLLIARKA